MEFIEIIQIIHCRFLQFVYTENLQNKQTNKQAE